MSRQLRRTAYTVAALAALVVCGAGISGVAAAAPAFPSPASTAPSSADATPERPTASDAPAPSLLSPLDASNGLLGMRRGTVHSATTPDLSDVPVARILPRIGVTPLPKQQVTGDEGATDDTATDETAADGASAPGSSGDSGAATPADGQ
jgi:hypothetical protein